MLAAALLAGCGGPNGGDPSPRPAETIDPPPKPFEGGATSINEAGGFSVSVPHGWSARQRGALTVLVSPDEAVAVALAADRSDEALDAAPEEIARAAITALPGFTDVEAAGTVPFEARYPAVEASGSAVRTSNNLRQSFRSFVLERSQLSVFTVLASHNANARSPFAKQVDAIVRSLRGRPVVVPG